MGRGQREEKRTRKKCSVAGQFAAVCLHTCHLTPQRLWERQKDRRACGGLCASLTKHSAPALYSVSCSSGLLPTPVVFFPSASLQLESLSGSHPPSSHARNWWSRQSLTLDCGEKGDNPVRCVGGKPTCNNCRAQWIRKMAWWFSVCWVQVYTLSYPFCFFVYMSCNTLCWMGQSWWESPKNARHVENISRTRNDLAVWLLPFWLSNEFKEA